MLRAGGGKGLGDDGGTLGAERFTVHPRTFRHRLDGWAGVAPTIEARAHRVHGRLVVADASFSGECAKGFSSMCALTVGSIREIL